MLCLAQVLKLSIEKCVNEYRAMAHITCEMMWLKNLLMELDFRQPGPMPKHCDNQSAIYTCPESCSP